MAEQKPKKPVEFKLKFPVKVDGTLYGDKFIIDNGKRHFKFTSLYEPKPAYINFNQVESFSVTYDPKKYLWAVGLILLFIIVGLLVLMYKINLPNCKIEIKKKNGDLVNFRLNLDSANQKLLQEHVILENL